MENKQGRNWILAGRKLANQGEVNDLSAFFLGQLSLKQALQLHWIQAQTIDDERLVQLDSTVKKNALGFNDYF